MRIGVVLPQTEIGPTVGAVRAYGLGVEELGYQHVLAYDHVVGADPEVHAPWSGPYDVDTEFHEPFVLFGFLAGCTSLELVTGITILPQRPTVLVAKQAAEVDLLTRGGFRLGVGIGRCRCHHLRQAKIEDFDAVVASHQNVCGLEVAMDDACRVRRGDGVSDRTANRESAIDGKSTRRDQVVKRRAGDILHHNAGQAADEEDVVNGDDSRMIE